MILAKYTYLYTQG